MSERKVVGRNVAVALGTICVVLSAGLIATLAYYVPMINEKNAQLYSSVTSLQDELNGLLNSTGVPIEAITGNPSAWVNKTVTVEGNLRGPEFHIAADLWPWGFELSSGNFSSVNQTIGVDLSANTRMSTDFWGQFSNVGSRLVRIYGVVEKGLIISSWGPSIVTYYVEAKIVELL